ncbi:MAG: HEAT repeat domain-containing protein [Thermostichales cyanobacterium DRC_bins_46]
MWSRKYRQLSQRLQALKETREETVFSPDLSAQTLAVAPDFWARQHGAVSYVQRQIQRVSGQLRLWGGSVLLALMADVLLVMGGLTLVQQVSQVAGRSETPSLVSQGLDGVKGELLEVLRRGSPADQLVALELLNRLMTGQTPVQPADSLLALDTSSTDALLQSIYQLGQSQSPAAIDPLVMRLSDPRRDVRMASVYALGEVSIALRDGRGWNALHQLLLHESDTMVRQAAVGTIARMTDTLGIPN